MGKRNMKRISEKVRELMLTTKYLCAYGLDIDEMCELHLLCLEGKDIEAVSIAFRYGFALGTRAHNKKHIPVL